MGVRRAPRPLQTRYADLGSPAWRHGESADMSHPGAQKDPNGYGLFDMPGNPWEWVDEDYLISGKMLKVLRGGSFFNPARDLRVPCSRQRGIGDSHRRQGAVDAGGA